MSKQSSTNIDKDSSIATRPLTMATSSDEEKNKRTDAVSPDSSPDAKAPLHESTPQSPPTPPNGGLGAWLCVLGAFFIFTNTRYLYAIL